VTAIDGASTIGIYGWCSDLESTPGGLESLVVQLAHYLSAHGVPVVVHCLGPGTGGWHVRDKEFRVGGHVGLDRANLHAFWPAHGPGVQGAVAENLAVSRRFDESVILAIGTRDSYVFDIATMVARDRDLPSVAIYSHAGDERWYRGQFTARGAGVAGLASPQERAEFEASGVETVRRLGADYPAVSVPTEYVRGQLSALLAPAEMAKVFVVFHGVDAERFPARSEPWDGTGPWLHVSRCAVPNATHKNFMWSCEFVRAAAAGESPLSRLARLELCGEGNAAPLLRLFAQQNELADRITIAGNLNQAALAQRYRRSAFLLVPSMMEAECKVIVEAVLSGCAPIVLDYAGSGEVMRRLGLSELLVRGVSRRFDYQSPDESPTGYVETVEPDLDAALGVLTRCLRDPAGTSRALAAAAEIARAEFTIEATVRALRAGLRRLGIEFAPEIGSCAGHQAG
jgi:glycosyltransferase involved in cell wall biosynthesis